MAMGNMEQIPAVLAFDVGNSAVHFAAVQGDKVGPLRVFRQGDLAGLGQAAVEAWHQLPMPKKLAAASVNPPALERLEAILAEALGDVPLLVIGRDLPLPLDSDLPNPNAIGVDRLCCAAAAFDRLGVACVVADFGTAITIDYVSDEGVFRGGAILPGLRMGAASLNANTARLPLVELRQPDWVMGKNTQQAIIGGLVFGARGALRHLVEAYASEAGHWPIVIATGGDAELVCGDPNESDLVQAIVPDLAVRGVAAAYYRSLLK